MSQPTELPERVGPYRVLGLLGQGATGRVYRAEESAPKREVALKVLHGGDPRFAARFQREIALLGALEHPGIARLYAAGTAETATGPLPYLAMEYVRGSDLLTHAEAQRLPVPERLRLLAAICQAVHHAHTRGIVHRDLKPANLFVDADGHPKVLDFGIAHVVAGDADLTQMTRAGEVLGTLPYMSWEQLAGEPAALDPRADVFALGVIAYQLLSGRLPFAGGTGTSLVQALRERQERSPEPLSRGLPAARGDLETIVMKAMAAEPAVRYGSAAELAADIERYLDRRPIEARPPTAAYVARLFVRRHRALAGGAALALLAILIGAALAVSFGVSESQARHEAETRLAENRAITDFLEEMLTSANPDEARGSQLTVRELLDDAHQSLGDGSRLPEPVALALERTIGLSYLHLGETAQALKLLRQAETRARTAEGGSRYGQRRAQVDLGNALNEFGEAPEAERLLRATLDAWPASESVPAPERALRLSLRKELAQAARNQGRIDESIAALEAATREADVQLGPLDEESLGILYSLASAYNAASRYDDAARSAEQLIERRTQFNGPRHPLTLDARMLRAHELNGREDYRGAAAVLKALLDDQVQVLGETNATTLLTRLNLGVVLAASRDPAHYADAAGYVRQALDGYRTRLEPGHNKIIAAMTTLSFIEQLRRNYPEAERLNLEALRLTEDSASPGFATNMSVRSNYGNLLVEQGKFEAALPQFERAVRDSSQHLGANHPDVAIYTLNQGECLRRMGRFDEATVLLERATARLRAALGATHPRVVKGESRLALARVHDRKAPAVP